jgi:hypothetical protein
MNGGETSNSVASLRRTPGFFANQTLRRSSERVSVFIGFMVRILPQAVTYRQG